jgi:hypothetical protein
MSFAKMCSTSVAAAAAAVGNDESIRLLVGVKLNEHQDLECRHCLALRVNAQRKENIKM